MHGRMRGRCVGDAWARAGVPHHVSTFTVSRRETPHQSVRCSHHSHACFIQSRSMLKASPASRETERQLRAARRSRSAAARKRRRGRFEIARMPSPSPVMAMFLFFSISDCARAGKPSENPENEADETSNGSALRGKRLDGGGVGWLVGMSVLYFIQSCG
jgi:hypothetical protein